VGDFYFFRGSAITHGRVETLDELFLATSRFQTAIEADPDNFNAWQHYGIAEAGSAEEFAGTPTIQQQFYRKAFERLKTAHNLYPQNADISLFAARMLDAQGKYDEAEPWFAQALRWNDGSRLVHWWYGDHLKAKREWQKALHHYWQILHKHKIGGRKRMEIQRSIDECERRLREEGKTPLPPP
jgi:tetratricopeptide (TPR) repeat protein